MRDHFVANFQGTRDRPPVTGDLRHIKQQPGDTLQKYIQRFNNTCLMIPKVSDEAIIFAFSDGVRDVKMKEELAIHEELCTSQELFNLATRCAHYKKRYIHDILGRTNFFFCHTYDTSMTIIVTKPSIIIDVVGSYFYDKKS